MTVILAVDAATEGCSAALFRDGAVRAARRSAAPREHARLLLPYVDAILKESGLALADLDALACGLGPGSFTGVRTGVGVAQGLAFGAGKKLVGITDLAALALRAARVAALDCAAAATDARMGEVYLGLYVLKDGFPEPLVPEAVLPPGRARERIAAALGDRRFAAAGTGFRAYPELAAGFPGAVRTGDDLPDAAEIAEMAARVFAAGGGLDPADVRPVYLRDRVAWKKAGEQKPGIPGAPADPAAGAVRG